MWALQIQEQERLGGCLQAERDRFMEVLGRIRRERVHLEAFASSLIQAAFRGYQLRKRCEQGREKSLAAHVAAYNVKCTRLPSHLLIVHPSGRR